MTSRITSILLCGILVMSMGGCADKSQSSADADKQPSGAAPSIAVTSSVAAPSATSQPALAIAGVNADNYPRVDGSTANLPLIAEVYSRVCGVSREEGEALAEVSGTARAWESLAEKRADILIVYEAPASVTLTLEQANTKLEVKPIGRDGLVFLVNSENKVDGLTQEQLRDIYTGKVTDWGAVGGETGDISPFQRNEDSGSQTMFLKLLMGSVAPMKPPMELVSGGMGALIDSVASYDGSKGAIGYSVYYYAQEMYKNPKLKLLSVDGVAPTAKSIGDGSYPLVNDFFVAIRADEPQGSPARLLYDWLVSESGKDTLIDAGYVAIN